MLRGMKAREEPPNPGAAAVWNLYILRCGDGSFYTGVTTDIERRVREHQEGKASRYTRTHGPVILEPGIRILYNFPVIFICP